MRTLITFCMIIMATVFVVVGVVKDTNSDATLDLSSGLNVIASQGDMVKSAMSDNKIVFSADDFERALNIAEVSTITFTSVPSTTDGCLCVGDVLVSAGQTVSGDNLSLLNFRVANDKIKESAFKFKVNGGEYEITCRMYLLDRENSAPTLSMEDEKTFNVSTHQSVRIYGKVGAYDPDGDDLRYEVVTYAKNGVLDFDSETGEYSYMPSGSYFGSDYFEYVALDEYGNYSRSGRVNLNVEKINTDVVYCDMQEHKYHHAAISMTEMNVMNGATIGESTYFMPDKSVSRIDFVVMLMNTIGEKSTLGVYDTGFDDDVEIPQSMKGYVHRAREIGIPVGLVNENGEYLMRPSEYISRSEAALMVSALLENEIPTVKPTFADKDEIPAWASDAVYSLNSKGILESENGRISPNAPLTRSQLAQMLYNLANLIK